jgi:membrane protease YdiL (CAAX protease family)
MTDDPQQPLDARPVGIPILARPATLPPSARAPVPPPLAYAVALPPRLYPESDLTRWQAALDLALIFACVVVSQIGADLIAPWAADTFPELGVLWTNTLMGIVTILAILGVVLARRLPIASVGLAVPHRNRAIVGTLAAVPACYMVALPAVGLYLYLAGVDMTEMARERQELFDMVPETSLMSLLLLAVFTGIHEELLFRGFILTRIWALARSKVAAVAIGGVLFGLLHAYQGPIGVIQTTAVGLVLGTIVTLTRSLWPAIIAHVIFNGVSLALIPFISDHMEEFLDPLTTTQAAGV